MTSTIRQLTYGECSDGELYIQEVDNPDIQVAYVLHYGDFNKTLALAQLFAAAPDLLGALEELLAMCQRQENFNDDGDGCMFERASAAIAKARGKK
jgi:hypothetical protein